MTDADELAQETAPGSSQDAAPRASQETGARFVAAAPLTEVPPGRVVAVRVEGRSIALVNDGGVIHALDGDCSHAGGPLGEGRTAGCLIACPWHGAVFDARTGEPARGPARKPVATHAVRVDGDTVLVAVDGPDPADGDDEASPTGFPGAGSGDPGAAGDPRPDPGDPDAAGDPRPDPGAAGDPRPDPGAAGDPRPDPGDPDAAGDPRPSLGRH